MALNFTMISRDAVTAAADPNAFDPEFKAEWHEAWDALKDRPSMALTIDFGDAETRNNWFKMAVKYGKTQSVNVRMSKGSDSANDEHGKLTFYMEDQNIARERAQEAQRKAERNLILNAHGHTPRRGRKNEEEVAKEDEILKRHYSLKPEEQEKILSEYMNA